jgi:hypothetical protein
MRALTVEELGFVSGGNVEGPMFNRQGHQQLNTDINNLLETVIVWGQRKSGGGSPPEQHLNDFASDFGGTTQGRMTDYFGAVSDAAANIRRGLSDADFWDESAGLALFATGLVVIGVAAGGIVVGASAAAIGAAVVTTVTVGGVAYYCLRVADEAFGDPTGLR